MSAATRTVGCAALTALLALAPGHAAAETAAVRPEPFEVREAMIPMRDGVRLNTKIFVPAGFAEGGGRGAIGRRAVAHRGRGVPVLLGLAAESRGAHL
jgi:hypothetical protein